MLRPVTEPSKAGPVSAFAARKATHPSINLVRSPIEQTASPVTQLDDEADASELPRKKRRGGQRPKLIGISQPIIAKDEQFEPVEEEGYSSRNRADDGDKATEGESDSTDSEIPKQSTAPVQRLSTFLPTGSNILSETETEWTVKLHLKDTLALLGQYDIWVRSGAISILGAVIHASSTLHRVYAPSTHSIPFIRPISNPYGTGNSPVEVTIVSCGSRIRLLKQLAPKFARIWNGKEGFSQQKRSFVNVQSSAGDPHGRPLRLISPPPDWQVLVSRLLASNKERSVAVMVCGPKGSGKSTFCRLLANALSSITPITKQGANTVVYLDIDPGQPEYSPPGELSLIGLRSYNLGPPFTHPRVPGDDELIRAHHFGHLSPKDGPNHFYSCALDLYSNYRRMAEKQGSCPLIVNCSGWIQGSGLELLTNLMQGLDLTDVVYMSTTGPEEVIDALSEAAIRKTVPLHQLSSQASEFSTRTPADLRTMQSFSYFHLDEPEGGKLRWNPYPLVRTPPLVAHYAGSKQDIFAVMVLGDEQNPEFLDSMLDGSIVSITVVEDDSVISLGRRYDENGQASGEEICNEPIIGKKHSDIEDTSEDTISTPSLPRNSAGIPYIPAEHRTVEPLSPTTSHSLGQALIRGIDTQTQAFHLLTPINVFQLIGSQAHPHRKIVLVRGHLDTPTWAYAELMNFERARARRRQRELGSMEVYGPEDVREWAEKQPWASIVEGGRTGSGKVRRIRRDIRYKGQGAADSSN